MDIFQKCYEPSLAKELKAAGCIPISTPSSPGRMWR